LVLAQYQLGELDKAVESVLATLAVFGKVRDVMWL
jgi:hypothetical protein